MTAPTSRRISNWPAALNRFIDARRATPFAWGEFDCLMAAADCCHLLTGEDPAAAYRGRYTNEEEAQAIINGAGGWAKLLAKVAKAAGYRRIATNLAQRGDIVTCLKKSNQLGRSAAGICLGGIAAFPAPRGWVFLPLTACHRQAWRVG